MHQKEPFDIREYEQRLVKEVDDVFERIIRNNQTLNIRAKSRAGSEISEFLEERFVEEINVHGHSLLNDAEKSPRGATKHPYDARCRFVYQEREEEVWIDVKAFKISSADSNPDMGTINKVIKFIQEGNFYILYVFVFYDEEGEGLKFVKRDNDRFTQSYLLKDVSSTLRLNAKNQLQVNVSAEPEYRTRTAFIQLLKDKHEQCLRRMIERANNKLAEMDFVYEELWTQNNESEPLM